MVTATLIVLNGFAAAGKSTIAQKYIENHSLALALEADAIARLMARGTWSEKTSPPLAEKDLPPIETLLERMETTVPQRPNTIQISLKGSDPDTTYRQLLDVTGA